MDDPSQHDRQIGSAEALRKEAAFRRQITSGAKGLVVKSNKWDVEYEGKDAKGTLERAFNTGWGDARSLPEKMVGETTAMAVARGMGRGHVEGGITRNKSNSIDGTDDAWVKEDDEKLRQMRLESQEAHAPPPIKTNKKTAAKCAEQQKRLEAQWAVGLTGGSYGMHTRHVATPPPAFKTVKESKKAPPGFHHPMTPEPGPPSPTRSPKSRRKKGGRRSNSPSPTFELSNSNVFEAKAKDVPENFDRKGPNWISGPVPRDGFVSDAYAALAGNVISKMNSEEPTETGQETPALTTSLW